MSDPSTHSPTRRSLRFSTPSRTGRIPGAVLGIVDADGGRALRVAGLAQLEPEPVPMTRETRCSTSPR